MSENQNLSFSRLILFFQDDCSDDDHNAQSLHGTSPTDFRIDYIIIILLPVVADTQFVVSNSSLVFRAVKDFSLKATVNRTNLL